MDVENAIVETRPQTPSTAAACSRPGKPDPRRARAGRQSHRRRAPGACGPFETKTAVGSPISRAAPRPAASATFEITTAISTPFRRPARIDSAMARKLEPRPESRMPRRVGRELEHPSGAKAPSLSAFRPGKPCPSSEVSSLLLRQLRYVYCTRRSPFTTRPIT